MRKYSTHEIVDAAAEIAGSESDDHAAARQVARLYADKRSLKKAFKWSMRSGREPRIAIILALAENAANDNQKFKKLPEAEQRLLLLPIDEAFTLLFHSSPCLADLVVEVRRNKTLDWEKATSQLERGRVAFAMRAKVAECLKSDKTKLPSNIGRKTAEGIAFRYLLSVMQGVL